jgi:hypothetical protein
MAPKTPLYLQSAAVDMERLRNSKALRYKNGLNDLATRTWDLHRKNNEFTLFDRAVKGSITLPVNMPEPDAESVTNVPEPVTRGKTGKKGGKR